MNYQKSVLPNGLRVLTVPMQGTNTVTVLVLCGTGSDYESKEIGGISHFLEHMFFKGTVSRSTDAIKHELDGMGSLSNAFTSHELTGYYIKAAQTYLSRSLELLADIYHNSVLSEEEIERERQVVIEEMHKDYDTPTLYIWWAWERLLYGDQQAGWDVIGTEEIIRRLSREDFVNYFHHQYVAANTAVVVAGNFDQGKTVGDIRNMFSHTRVAPPFRKKAEYREPTGQDRVRIVHKKTDQTHITVGFYGYDAHHPLRWAADVLATLLGGSMSSRMWDRIRDKLGLAYTVATEHSSYSNRGEFVTYAGVDHKNVEKTITVALEEYKRVKDELVSDAELHRVKSYICGTTLMGLEQSNAVAHFVGGEEMLTGKPMTTEEVFLKVNAVTPEDIQAVARDLFRQEKLRLALIGPFEDTKPFERILTI